MGVDIVQGSTYLIKVNSNEIYNHHIREIIQNFSNKIQYINYLSDFNAFIIIDNTHCERYNYIKDRHPINWSFSSYCNKYKCDIIPEFLQEIIDYKFKKEEYETVDIIFSDFIIEHGWYDIGFISS
jgi:hypothetical protein